MCEEVGNKFEAFAMGFQGTGKQSVEKNAATFCSLNRRNQKKFGACGGLLRPPISPILRSDVSLQPMTRARAVQRFRLLDV